MDDVPEAALESALSSLDRRDRTAAEVDRLLARHGFDHAERAGAIEHLRRTGLVDDARFAETRAASLARRGEGDALIRERLRHAGVSTENILEALAGLEAESVRAARIVARRGASAKTVRYLRARGFSDDVVGNAIAAALEGELR